MSRASTLASYYMHTADANYLAKDLARYTDTTSAKVHDSAKMARPKELRPHRLHPETRRQRGSQGRKGNPMRRALALITLLLTELGCGEPPVPVAPPPPPSAPAEPKPADGLAVDRSQLPAPDPVVVWAPPTPNVTNLSNGIRVWHAKWGDLPVASLLVVIPRGSETDPKGKAGLAYLTADMFDEGAGKRSALELSEDLQRLRPTTARALRRLHPAIDGPARRKLRPFRRFAGGYGPTSTLRPRGIQATEGPLHRAGHRERARSALRTRCNSAERALRRRLRRQRRRGNAHLTPSHHARRRA